LILSSGRAKFGSFGLFFLMTKKEFMTGLHLEGLTGFISLYCGGGLSGRTRKERCSVKRVYRRSFDSLRSLRMTAVGDLQWSSLNFGEEVEEGVDALAKLGLDLFAGAFEKVHGDPRAVSILELNGSFADSGNFLSRKQAETIYQR
jgi:hypothetical protein